MKTEQNNFIVGQDMRLGFPPDGDITQVQESVNTRHCMSSGAGRACSAIQKKKNGVCLSKWLNK